MNTKLSKDPVNAIVETIHLMIDKMESKYYLLYNCFSTSCYIDYMVYV